MTQRKDRIPGGVRDLLQSTAVARVATFGPEGEAQINPVWFEWNGGSVVFSQTKTRQKLRKMRRDREIGVSVGDPESHRPGDERAVFVRPQHTTHEDG